MEEEDGDTSPSGHGGHGVHPVLLLDRRLSYKISMVL